MLANELYLNDFRDVKEALIVQYAVNVLPVVFDPLFCLKIKSKFVIVLQPL